VNPGYILVQPIPSLPLLSRRHSAMRLKNINGTLDKECSCGSWLKHWEKFSGQTTLFCQAVGCVRADVVGAHVQVAINPDNKWYIYPLCDTHSRQSGELDVSGFYKLVPANRRETCEK
jgi:hypothetical protein